MRNHIIYIYNFFLNNIDDDDEKDEKKLSK